MTVNLLTNQGTMTELFWHTATTHGKDRRTCAFPRLSNISIDSFRDRETEQRAGKNKFKRINHQGKLKNPGLEANLAPCLTRSSDDRQQQGLTVSSLSPWLCRASLDLQAHWKPYGIEIPLQGSFSLPPSQTSWPLPIGPVFR